MKEVSDKAWQQYVDYMQNHFNEDSPRTRLSELLEIANESRDYFPSCHAKISAIYFADFQDFKKSKYHADLARQQNPNDVLAIVISIYLNLQLMDNNWQKTRNGINNVKDIPYFGIVAMLSASAVKKRQENPFYKLVINDINLLTTVALEDYFEPDDGFRTCEQIANLMLELQDMIREEKSRLFPALGTSVAKALLDLPWGDVKALNEEEVADKAKLMRRIKAETMI